jgi:hypothetical protein
MGEGDDQKLWDLVDDPRLPRAARAVHLSTFDHAIVEYQYLPEYARLLREFVAWYPAGANRVDHLLAWADACEKIYAEEKPLTCLGICFWHTSVADDPWQVYEGPDDAKEIRPYHTGKDTKHWLVFEALTEKEIAIAEAMEALGEAVQKEGVQEHEPTAQPGEDTAVPDGSGSHLAGEGREEGQECSGDKGRNRAGEEHSGQSSEDPAG